MFHQLQLVNRKEGIGMATLIKIDRNGSKHYEGWITCDRCSGRGLYATGTINGQLRITPVDGGVCHKCLGTGKVLGKWIERTPEYQAKLDAKRAEKAAQRAAEIVEQKIRERAENARESLETLGIPEGKIFLFLSGSNDAIRELGGRFNTTLGWYIGHPVDGMDLMKVDMGAVFTQDDWGRFHVSINKSDLDDMKNAERARRHPGAWVGQVGQKITVPVTYNFSASFEVRSFSGFGTETMFIHNFTDADNNQLIWKTGKGICFQSGDHVILTGAVKARDEYKGQKQTVMTRCKLVKS